MSGIVGLVRLTGQPVDPILLEARTTIQEQGDTKFPVAGLESSIEERTSRGEFVMAYSRLCIFVGWRELPAIRRELAKTLDEDTVFLGRCV